MQEKISFPLKKLEAVIKLAKESGVQYLEFSGLKIAFAPKPLTGSWPGATLNTKTDAGGEKLTQREIENLLLFGAKDIT